MSVRKNPAPLDDAGPSPSLSLTDRILLGTALVAGIAVTAVGEWELARQVGISRAVAPLLAVVIDVYVIAAVRAAQGRDVAAALTMMGGAQVATHLLTTHHISASVPLVAAVSLVTPVVIWRVHALAGAGRVPKVPKPVVDLSRVGTPPWKPSIVKAVSPALTPRPEVVTARVDPKDEKASESPPKPSADEVVRSLYDALGSRRPSTRHIAEALRRNGLACSDGTCRSVRQRVEKDEPELKALPSA
ncbi:hypothetical protein ABZ904_18095 [Streptomyces sp. NPDC046900]|uniref:hypothetical protein n=1 Tax=Streptomyces sp. NPDC046900 TaxID=3155473 RepID=UPI0033FE7097